MKNIIDTLKQRGFIKQITNEAILNEKLNKGSVVFYCGFDPTADSLHVGHFVQLLVMKKMQEAGHKPLVLIGGATAVVGDPSGKTDMREMLSRDSIKKNVEAFKKQMRPFLTFTGDNGAVIVNNADWLSKLNYLDTIRDIGVHFSVNRMLTADAFKARMEREQGGLSFLELNYMVLQAYDFWHLYKNYGCTLQIGGSDQWSNIIAGADLIRRMEVVRAGQVSQAKAGQVGSKQAGQKGQSQAEQAAQAGVSDEPLAFGWTNNLLLTSTGEKMGKTVGGAVWLCSKKTAPYDFYQYFRNLPDADIENCLKLLTDVDLETIALLVKHKDARINEAKKVLAYEVTKLVHGEKVACEVEKQAVAAFRGDTSDMPSVDIKCKAEYKLIDLLVDIGVAASKSEARRLIEGGAISVDKTKIVDINVSVGNKTFVLHKGKKTHIKVNMLKD